MAGHIVGRQVLSALAQLSLLSSVSTCLKLANAVEQAYFLPFVSLS